MLTPPTRTPVIPIRPPIGVPTGPLVGGGFINAAAFPVAHINLLPPMPTSQSPSMAAVLANQNAGASALTSQTMAAAMEPSIPVNNNAAGAGSVGSTGLEGGADYGSTNIGPVAVGKLAMWQLSNPKLDMLARLGLPVAGYLLWRSGHAAIGGTAIAAAAALWANRLTRINL